MSANERTPLIAVVHVAPPRQRYPHQTLRRFCTIALTTIPIAVIIAILVLFFLGFGADDFFDEHPHRRPQAPYPPPSISLSDISGTSTGLSYEDLQQILLDTPQEKKIREWSQYYTAGPHLAGQNRSLATWTQELWQGFGIADSRVVAYDTYLNYPLGHRLALLEKGKETAEDPPNTPKTSDEWTVKFEATLEEDVLDEDSSTGLPDRIPTFHGYSANGNVTAPYVFVNYGTYQDFEDLQKAGIPLEGKIALAKYGAIFRGLKLKRASEFGMIGAVLYSDPGDDGEVTEKNGYKSYPEGPARHPSSVQRGSTQFLSVAPGDPTTPGYPSKPGVPRQPVDGAIPSIPSLPISYQEALPLLEALNGHGPNASSFPSHWQTGGLDYKGINYNIGPSPDGLVLNLVNEQNYTITPQWDVIGIINGTSQDEVVIMGNHRDAWIAGGAGDPNSGSAALNEVARSFGVALKKGWKPRRTIVLASWDGEEYGLIGSTEWVEEYLAWLNASAVAYLNVDVGTRGPEFDVAAAPLLNRAIIETTKLVQSPNQTIANQSVYDIWLSRKPASIPPMNSSTPRIRTMGSGSDFTAFQDHAGIPCVDLGFSANSESAVYHYHSNYDSFYWMDKYGDPGWHYHVTAAKIWGLLAVKLAEEPLISFSAEDYATGLDLYLDQVQAKADDLNVEFSFEQLRSAISKLYEASSKLDAIAASLSSELARDDIPLFQRTSLLRKAKKVNKKYQYLERAFLYPDGLDSRPWFKHVVFAPGLWTGYAGATYPGLVEALDAGNSTNAKRWESIITDLVNDATRLVQA
ncbi:Zn-dependent exopeptidase [Viridothelium virens]|uniref:Zn-dependent exopeptidase n=1 Tax=Viridothelium virens TaxID=1048519 RepID=A0A6A6HHA2_VIRVR|nr:Zn-dependent exopeptidase [Viridothelium virens]